MYLYRAIDSVGDTEICWLQSFSFKEPEIAMADPIAS
jgi:hypothetical protein